MKVTEFKLWFEGLMAGLPEGTAIPYATLKALKEKIEILKDSSEDFIDSPPKESQSGNPAQTIPSQPGPHEDKKEATNKNRKDFQEFWEEVERSRKAAEGQRPPLVDFPRSWPTSNEDWGFPKFGFGDGPSYTVADITKEINDLFKSVKRFH